MNWKRTRSSRARGSGDPLRLTLCVSRVDLSFIYEYRHPHSFGDMDIVHAM